jgi:hypothetical protein
MGSMTISAKVTSKVGTSINVGETFTVTVTVKAGEFPVADAQVTLKATSYTELVGSCVYAVGDLDPYEPWSQEVALKAVRRGYALVGAKPYQVIEFPTEPVLEIGVTGVVTTPTTEAVSHTFSANIVK